MTAFLRSDAQGAIMASNKALSIVPTLERALIPRIQAQFEIGVCDEVESTALRTLAVNPKNVRAYAYRAICETYNGRRELAAQYATRAIVLSPDSALAHVAHAYVFMTKDDWRAAIAFAARAETLDDNLALAHAALGISLALRGTVDDLALAATKCQQAVSMRPRLAEAWRCQAAVANAAGDYAGVLAATDKVMRLAPTLSPAYGLQVVANLGLGRPQAAARVLQGATKLWPRDAKHRIHLCEALLRRRDVSDVLTQFKRVASTQVPAIDYQDLMSCPEQPP
jgi:tetratricopeptide (TPR) repeat protein